MSDSLDQRCINTVRFLAADAVQEAGSGHPGTPMGAAPMAYVLWDRFLKHNPANPAWFDRDRFVLSAGHASMLLYSMLHLTGYDLPMEELKRYRQWGSRTPGHPELGLTAGVEVTTGPLGQGFANGVGMAIAEQMLAAKYNRPGHEIIDHYIYSLVSDGDLMEGVASEAASLAGTLGLGKLVYLYDDNDISIEGDTDKAFREDVAARFRAYGWQVLGPVDGLDTDGIEAAIRDARAEKDKPSLVIVRSTIGYGSPSKAGTGSAHGEALGADEIAGARQALGWEYGPFDVPQEVYDYMRGALERGERAESEWLERFAEYERTYPEDAAGLRRDIAGELPTGWDSDLQPLYEQFTKPTASRSVSGKVIEAISSRADILVGGSADLAGSNKTLVEGRGSFLPESYSGRNLHFGVREHAMGSAVNGMAAHGGVIPYAATFLTFSDYMRPALRLAALSGLRALFIYTHDSLGLGGDGPTHQPVSHMMSLRAIPGLRVIRPADAHETIEAWRVAMERSDGPTVLVFSRQDLPLVDRSRGEPASGLARGAYIISDDSDGAGEPDVIIIGAGSEVKVAQAGAALLSEDGIKTRVVSMPSWDLFDAQPEDYRERVLPSSVQARVAVEAGSPLGWEHYVGLDGATIGVRGYGASAPGEEVLEKFGFTAQNVHSTALSVLERQKKKAARSPVVAHPPSGAA